MVSTDSILSAAVAAIGGTERAGQQRMATAVEHAFAAGEHLLVQAGTGTGKSLGYLAPALARVIAHPGERVVIATATLALQNQLATKDIPVALAAAADITGVTPTAAVLKGRSNYVCLYRVRDGVGGAQESLLGGAEIAETLRSDESSAPDSVVGAEVVALREWADRELKAGGLGDRDDAPTHGPRAWAQVSVSARECLGANACPHASECFVEEARARARDSDLIVTNHALLAIDALNGGNVLPEHSLVVIDEAHELAARVTSAASAELSPQSAERVAKRALAWLEDDAGLDLLEAVDTLRRALAEAPLERVTDPDSALVAALALLRGAARSALSQLGQESGADPNKTQAAAALDELREVAERMSALADADVVWISERERAGRQVNVAPLSVSAQLRGTLLAHSTTVLTSATLRIGGDFGAAAAAVGLRSSDRLPDEPAGEESGPAEGALVWRGLDVGSPFDYRGQGILYVARHLPPPHRDGIGPEALAEIAELVWAAGGRTLGLFASQRNADVAAAYVRRELPKLDVLCQGEAQLPELTKQFVADPAASLFGTLSLWQGVDVPGATCTLVIIDKVPFPRPDDPLHVARQQAASKAGGNGFMQVAAAQAGLLLAQGSGRLLRRTDDRGVVAVLDPRLVTKRYGSFLLASMPDFWTTTDREAVIGALRRLGESAGAAESDAP